MQKDNPDDHHKNDLCDENGKGVETPELQTQEAPEQSQSRVHTQSTAKKHGDKFHGTALIESSEEESEDLGLKIGDIIAPGGDHLNFGSFQENEIKHLWRMQITSSNSVVINEYGSNLIKNSCDPLAVVEAKIDMKSGQIPIDQTETLKKQLQMDKMGAGIHLHPIHEVSEGKECCPSPETGTQEAPAVESSQEIGDAEGVVIPNWGGQQEELQASVSITELVHELDTAEKEQDSSKTGGDTTSITTIDSQEVGIEGKRETTRQSERIKHQGDGNMKIAEKAEKAAAKKNLEGASPKKEDVLVLRN
ncbi:unnamed protein product [Urochloa humidicola]